MTRNFMFYRHGEKIKCHCVAQDNGNDDLWLLGGRGRFKADPARCLPNYPLTTEPLV